MCYHVFRQCLCVTVGMVTMLLVTKFNVSNIVRDHGHRHTHTHTHAATLIMK